MAMNIEKILSDAQLLVTRLRDHDTTADILIAHTQTLHKRLDAMKQYQDDINELNEIAKHRPRSTLVVGIAQENRQIRELQQENRELCLSLEEHQQALALIMQKYREQIMKLIQSNKQEKVIASKRDQSKDLEALIDKISEMASVMQKAICVDDEASSQDNQRLVQLQQENNGLRELLEVCTTAKRKILDSVNMEMDDKSCQTENNSGSDTADNSSSQSTEPINSDTRQETDNVSDESTSPNASS